MKVVAIIPSRTGSVRLVNKNKKKINGSSLVERTLKVAKKIKFINHIILTTDDKYLIKKLYKNEDIKIIKRPKNLANSKTRMSDVIFHTLKVYKKKFGKVDIFILLQPTSPFRSIIKINLAFKTLLLNKLKKAVVSVSRVYKKEKKFFLIKNNLLDLVKKKNFEIKNFENIYKINGNFYLSSVNFYEKYKSFYVKRMTCPIDLKSKILSIDIDTKEDFNKAKKFSKYFEE